MKTTLKSVNVRLTIILLGSFWLIAPFMARDVLFDAVNGLCIAACTGVILIYYPSVANRFGTWRWFMLNRLSGPHYFILALTGIMGHIIFRCAWNWVWRLLCQVDDIQNSLWVAFNIWFATIMAGMFMVARDLEEGHIPQENWWWIGMATAVGLAMAFTTVSFMEPDAPSWLKDFMLPIYQCRL